MKAKLVHSSSHQRWYELSEPIHKGISDMLGEIDIVTAARIYCRNRIRTEFQKDVLDSFNDGCRLVVVSDAHTHIERLVFPGIHVGDQSLSHWGIICEGIDGKHTIMINGGDADAVYADEVYLRHLCIINKLSWEGMEK